MSIQENSTSDSKMQNESPPNFTGTQITYCKNGNLDQTINYIDGKRMDYQLYFLSMI